MSVKKTTKNKGVTVKASDDNYTLTQTGAEVQADLDFAEGVATAISEATAGQALVSDGDGGVGVTDMPTPGISQADADLRYLQLSGGAITGAIKGADNKDLIAQSTDTALSTYLGNTNHSTYLQSSNNSLFAYHGVNVKNVLTGFNTEANPTLDGTEADLTGIKVDGTKYKVPSGGGGSSLYQHNILFGAGINGVGSCTIINNSSTAFDTTSFKNYISTNFSTDINHVLACTGYDKDASNNVDIFLGLCVLSNKFYLAHIIRPTDGTSTSYRQLASNQEPTVNGDNVVQIS